MLQVKEKMNAIMHKLNLVRSDGRLQSAQRTVAFDKHVSSLEAIEDEIRTLQNKVMGVSIQPFLLVMVKMFQDSNHNDRRWNNVTVIRHLNSPLTFIVMNCIWPLKKYYYNNYEKLITQHQ